MNLKRYIIEKSEEVGIDIIGFTDSDDMIELEEFLKLRKLKKYEAEFEEKDIKKRISPRNIMKNADTIIVIGVSYNFKDMEYINTSRFKLEGIVSKSAIGIDYHTVLKEKMNRLVDEIKKVKEDSDFFIGVDTTPLIDRYLAKKAGVGWFGKNCSIINDRYGSFIFIGYIMTNLELEKDIEVKNGCENCDMCINSCPVGAIGQNYDINARKCIAYLTQTKEKIPYELRERMQNKIYGCDTCQLVCPTNKDIIKKEIPYIDNIKKYNTHIDLQEIINISNKEFKNKYGDMAFSWRGKNIIKRNAIIVLGNMKKKNNISILKKTLKDDSSMIREYSAWSILNIDLYEGIEIIDEHIKKEKDENVKSEMYNIINYFKNRSEKL